MSTVFFTNLQGNWRKKKTADWSIQRAREMICALCGGELYPGESYFELEERAVCEHCLTRYARGYFAHRRRWVSRLAMKGVAGGSEGL